MAHLYYSDDAAGVEPGEDVALVGAEARHAATVSRVRAGEGLLVGDGAGTLAHAVVVSAEPARVVLRAVEVAVHPAPAPRILLAQALAKGARDEQAVQAATELGVDGIIPWEAARSVSRWVGAKRGAGAQRWRAIVREASKQSLRSRIPEVAELHSTRELVELAADYRMVVLEPSSSRHLTALEAGGSDTVLIVGPEGGIAPSELSALTDGGAETVRLGETVLRTSTAGPAALAVVNGILGRW